MKPARRVALVFAICAIVAITAVYFVLRQGEPQEATPQEMTYTVYLPLVASDYPNKLGVALTSGRCAGIVEALGAQYARGWHVATNKDCPRYIVQMPCVCCAWLADDVLAGRRQIEAAPGAVVLSANEPEIAEQANISPAAWAVYQHLLLDRFPEYKWASPAITIHPPWLVDFVDEYAAMYPGAPFPFDVLDWHCYYNTAAECIAHSEGMLALMDGWNAEGAGIEFAIISEIGIADPDELGAFLAWVGNETRIQRAVVFSTELYADGPWGNFAYFNLIEYGSEPVVLTERGRVVRDW
jgi:hypothetical protein